MKYKKYIAVVLLLMLLLNPATALAVVDQLAAGYVADYAGVLTEETEQYIFQQSRILDDATGAQIVVVTVDFLDGMDIEEYAYTIFNEWSIGDAEKQNGLLLLLAVGEENYWAMQGYGLEKDLSSGTLKMYLNDYLEPDFVAADYDAGVNKVYAALYEWFADYYQLDGQQGVLGSPIAEQQTERGSNSMMIIVILLIIIVIIISMNNRRKDQERKNDKWHDGSGGGGSFQDDYPRTGIPRMPRRSYIPPQHSGNNRRTNTDSMEDLFGGFGGGNSRGGGAGRYSGRPSKGISGGFKGFGGGKSRGGGAGRF